MTNTVSTPDTQGDRAAEIELHIAAAKDLLYHPRHNLTPEGRRWLEKELAKLERQALKDPS